MKNIAWRVYMAICALVLFGVLLSYAQPAATNAPVVVETPQVIIPVESPNWRGQLTFGLDRIPELRNDVFGIPLWQYVATFIYIFLALLAAKFLNYLVSVQLKKAAARTRFRFDDFLVELLQGPIKILALVLLLQLGLNLFHWPPVVERWSNNLFKVVLAISLTLVSLKIVDLGARFWRTRESVAGDKAFTDLFLPLLSKSLKAFLVIMAVLVTLDNMNVNIRTLLAGVSISGLALGLAAQDTVGNLFGAAAVFMDKPFKIGDRIKLGEVDGIVEEMGLRSTRVRNLDGHLITIPNKTMGNSTITNITLRPNIKTVMNIGVTYDTPAEKVAEAVHILREVYENHPQTGDLIIGFNQFSDSSLNILVVHFWKLLDYKVYIAGMHELNLEIKRRFDQAGISFAFPSRTVYLRQDNDWKLQLPRDAERPNA
jgi:MscS family membrane protein